QAPLTDLDDGVGPFVPGLLQRFDEELTVQAIAGREAQRGFAEFGRAGKRDIERGRRGDDHERVTGEQATTDYRPLGVALALAPAPPQARLALGKFHPPRAEELEVLRPAVGVRERGDPEPWRGGMRLDEGGDDERASGSGEPGDAQAGLSLGEGFHQLAEGGPLTQHHERLHVITASAEDDGVLLYGGR